MPRQRRNARTRRIAAASLALLLAWSAAAPAAATASEPGAQGDSTPPTAEVAPKDDEASGARREDASASAGPEIAGPIEEPLLERGPEANPMTQADEIPLAEPAADEPAGNLVAIIDTGCDESLCERAVSVIDDDPSDCCGRGSAVARQVLEQDPHARILSIKAADEQGRGSAADVCAALRVAIDADADIITTLPPSYGPDEQPSVDALVGEAIERGATVLAATEGGGTGSFRTFGAAFAHSTLQCRFHVSNVGDSQWMPIGENAPVRTKDGAMTPTTFGNYVNGYWQHIENMAFKVVQNGGPGGGIAYRVYYRNGGWDAWRADGAYSPSATGAGNVAMALQAVLTGNMAAAYTLTYRVRISDADPVTKVDGRDSPLGWTWPQASDGGTAGTTDYYYGLEDIRMWLTPRSYAHTVQARYQNPDGSYGGWTNERTGTFAFGSTVPSWSRAGDATYNAASVGAYTAGFATTTKQVSISRKSYYLDVNGMLDGVATGDCGGYGTFGFIVNGSTRAEGAADYYQTALAGSSWRIIDVRAKPGYTFDGAAEGAMSGTLGTAGAQAARLSFHTNTYAVRFDGNGATRGQMGDQAMRCHAAAPLAACTYERPGYSFEGWNTEPDGSGASYANGQEVTNLSLEDGAAAILYAQWRRDVQLPSTGSNDLADAAAAAFLLTTYGSATVIANRRKRR